MLRSLYLGLSLDVHPGSSPGSLWNCSFLRKQYVDLGVTLGHGTSLGVKGGGRNGGVNVLKEYRRLLALLARASTENISVVLAPGCKA